MNRHRWPAALLCAWLLFFATGAQAARWVPLEPGPDLKPVVVRVKDHPRDYYRLTPTGPLILTIDGPGRLRLLSRAELKHGDSPAVSYRIRVTEGKKTLEDQATGSSPADQVRLERGDAAICKSRNLIVPIPAGTHRIKIAQYETPSVLIRAFFSGPRRRNATMISITPVEAARSVTVSEGERLIRYYTVLPGRPVHFRIASPTSLELATRLDFDSTMHGVQVYRIGVSTGGRRVRDVTFQTTKATTATYTDLKERVASKLGRIVVPVGEGQSDIFVELLEPKVGSAEIHAEIPETSTGSEE